MLRPFLLIGIGGSGGKTLRVIRDELTWRLKEAGWPDGAAFPQAWQFLHIDVASHPDGDDPELPDQLPVDDFLGLVGAGLNYQTLDKALAQELPHNVELQSLGGWRPEHHKVTVSVDKGAGQFRAIGRVIALTQLDKIRSRISTAVDRITDADVKGQLLELNRLMGEGDAVHAQPDPVVIVVASISGGSGAGAVLDVCDVLRSIGKSWLDESVGILFAPDVFDEIPEANRRGVRPNALATLSELMAGYWTRGYSGMTEDTASLFEKRGLSVANAHQVGPRYPNLVGAKNANVSYGTQNEVYRGMGKALSAWITSGQIQSEMTGYFMGNRASASVGLTDRLGLKLPEMETPFTALGFSRVSLGREAFAQYAAQKIAREAVERILRQHLRGNELDENLPDSARVAQVAQSVWLDFLMTSGIDEGGAEKNQILDSLRDGNEVTSVVEAWQSATVSGTLQGIGAEGASVSIIQSRIQGLFDQGRPLVLADLNLARIARAKKWVNTIQDDLANHVVTYVANYGAPTAIALLTMLKTEMEGVIDEMVEEASRSIHYAGQQQQQIGDLLRRAGDKIPGRPEVIAPAVKAAAASLWYESEAELRRLAGTLIDDLITGVIVPLFAAIENAFQELGEDDKPEGSEPSKVQRWPAGTDVPKSLKPAKNEFLLDDVEKFPSVFDQQLLNSVGAETPGDAFVATVRSVITGADVDKAAVVALARQPLGAALSAVERLDSWVPRAAELRTPGSAPKPAVYRIKLRADDLLARAQHWVTDRERPVGRYVTMSLRSHLEDPKLTPMERTQRISRFAGQLQAAIERAKPLVEIDPQVLMAVHDKQRPEEAFVMGAIPLPPESEAGKKAHDVLVASGAFKEIGRNQFDDSERNSVDIFTVLAVPYEPVVFASLMRPIEAEWIASSTDVNARQSFWRWRRARTLPEFIPVAPPIRRAMVRGWFTGLALGQVKVGDPVEGGKIDIWIPSATGQGGAWTHGPEQLLRPMTSRADAIGALLESLPVALLKVFSDKDVKALAAYHRLTALGASGPDNGQEGGLETYEQLAAPLQRWLQSANVPVGWPAPDEKVGTATDTPEQRRAATLERFSVLKKSYDERFAKIEVEGQVTNVARDYELRHDILGALNDLMGALSTAVLSSDGDGEFQ